MSHWFTDKVLSGLHLSTRNDQSLPIPTKIISNGEFNSSPQTPEQHQVEQEMLGIGDECSKRCGIDRRSFFRTSAGMAAAFIAMNQVYGPLFMVDKAEAADLTVANNYRQKLAKQFIFDVQLHFVSDDFRNENLLEMRRYAAQNWNPQIDRPVKSSA